MDGREFIKTGAMGVYFPACQLPASRFLLLSIARANLSIPGSKSVNLYCVKTSKRSARLLMAHAWDAFSIFILRASCKSILPSKIKFTSSPLMKIKFEPFPVNCLYNIIFYSETVKS